MGLEELGEQGGDLPGDLGQGLAAVLVLPQEVVELPAARQDPAGGGVEADRHHQGERVVDLPGGGAAGRAALPAGRGRPVADFAGACAGRRDRRQRPRVEQRRACKDTGLSWAPSTTTSPSARPLSVAPCRSDAGSGAAPGQRGETTAPRTARLAARPAGSAAGWSTPASSTATARPPASSAALSAAPPEAVRGAAPPASASASARLYQATPPRSPASRRLAPPASSISAPAQCQGSRVRATRARTAACSDASVIAEPPLPNIRSSVAPDDVAGEGGGGSPSPPF